MTFLSRIAGYVRDTLIASTLGAGSISDALIIAFKIPLFFGRFLSGEGLKNAFIPMYIHNKENKGAHAATLFARHTHMNLLVFLIVFTAIFMIFIDQIVGFFTPGFKSDPEKIALTINLVYITFPYFGTFTLFVFYSSLLNTVGKFTIGTMAPLVFNLCFILFFYISHTPDDTPLISAYNFGWSIPIAGFFQLMCVVIAGIHFKVFPKPSWPSFNAEMRRLLILLGPTLLAVGTTQINTLIDTILASQLDNGAVSWLYFAERVSQLPLGVVGVSVSTALLPVITRHISKNNITSSLHTQNQAIELSFILAIPATFGIISLSQPIISILFGYNLFTLDDIIACSYALSTYTLGIPAYIGIKVLGPGFFARQDTITPTKIIMGTTVLNITLSLILMKPLGHIGLALATAISAWVSFVIMAFILFKRSHLKPTPALLKRLLMQVVSACLMTCLLYGVMYFYPSPIDKNFINQFLSLLSLITIGFISFAGFSLVTGALNYSKLKKLLLMRSPLS